MILSRKVWVDATTRYEYNSDSSVPMLHREYRPTPFGPACIAITGTQAEYLNFINCLVAVQYGSTPILALTEMRFLLGATRIWPAPHTSDPEVVIWYIPSVRVVQEEVAA